MKYIFPLILALFCCSAECQTVYKTPSGKKYHLETCRMVNNVSSRLTISEAIQKGLEPCKICKPPAQANSFKRSQKSGKGQAKTVQCRGITKSGTRCKHMTSIGNGYCFQHNPDK